jgi:IPT/TIG domain
MPLIETPNPNEAGDRAPGDPTVSLNPDGTPANVPAVMVATVPVNPTPTVQSDPAFVPSPMQQGETKQTAPPAQTPAPKAPVVSTINPTSGFANNDLALTVTGTDFDTGAKIVFAGTEQTTAAPDATTLTATVPAATLPNPGSFDVSVKNSDGTASNKVTFTAT